MKNKTLITICNRSFLFGGITMNLFNLFEIKLQEIEQESIINVLKDEKVNILEKSIEEIIPMHLLQDQKQKKNSFSYDVGETVGGSKKELAALRKQYLLEPALSTIERINELDPILAKKLLTKNTLFSWATYENMQQLGYDAKVARLLKLVIRTFPKDSMDTDVITYFKLMNHLSNELQKINTVQELKQFIIRTELLVRVEMHKQRIEFDHKRIEFGMKQNPVKFQSEQAKIKTLYLCIDVAEKLHFGILINFQKKFFGLNKVSKFFKDCEEVEWKDLLEKKAIRRSSTTTWRRILPENPQRISTFDVVNIEKPEDVQSLFNFKSIEFGNYVNDIDAKLHLVNAAAALQDLAYILEVENADLSQKGSLSLGFGSRGSGNALAHYERGYHIINLTKKKGGLGVLAHEWFHSYDNFLGRFLLSDKKNSDSMLSENIDLITDEVIKEALVDLLNAIKVGSSIDHIILTPEPISRKIYPERVKNLYEQAKGDLTIYMTLWCELFDKTFTRRLFNITYEPAREKLRKKHILDRKKKLAVEAELLQSYHFAMTGEIIDTLAYPTQYTKVYLNSVKTDKGRIGKYWSSDVELLARSFESYVQTKLQILHWKNDYLVAGLDYVYASGEELEKINKKMEIFLKLVSCFLK